MAENEREPKWTGWMRLPKHVWEPVAEGVDEMETWKKLRAAAAEAGPCVDTYLQGPGGPMPSGKHYPKRIRPSPSLWDAHETPIGQGAPTVG